MTTLEAAPMRSVNGGPREVLTLAWPAIVNMMSFTMLGLADTYFAGSIGTPEQGAVGFCSTLVWAELCFFLGTLELVQTFAAQSIGAGRPDRAARWGSAGLHLAVVFAVALLPTLAFARPVFEIVGIAPEMIPAADSYFRIRVLGAVFFLLVHVGDGYYRGIGDTVTPMWIGVAANALNFALDWFLVIGVVAFGIPSFGVEGLAWATVVATVVQAAVYWWIGRRRSQRGQPTPRYRDAFSREEARELFRVGAPAGLHWLLEVSAWTAFTLAVARLDPVQSAANLIGISLIRLSFMPGFGMSKAAATLVGQYLGAKDIPSAFRSGWTSTWLTCVYMVAAGIAYYVFREPLVRLFTSDPEVIAVGAQLMAWAALFQLGDGVQLVVAGALRGAGDTKFVMWASLTGAWGVFAPLSFTLMVVRKMGVEAGWIGVNAWVIVLALLLIWRFRSGVWTKGGINLEPRPVPKAEVV